MYRGMQPTADHSVNNCFLGKTNETYERYVFNTRKQKARETVDDYVAALCTLASTCNFCDCLKDSLLRDRIVLGIKDSSTRKRLLKEADLNLEACITMCRAAETETTSPSHSQPVKTVTQTEDATAVQAGSVSSGGQGRPGKKQDFSIILRRCDQMVSSDGAKMSEVNFKTELDDSDDDSALQWTTEHQSSGFPWNRTERNKLGQAWSMEEDSPDQPSAVYNTPQPMSDNTSGSLLSLNTSHECYLCSAAFVLVSSLELHLASVHGEKLHIVLPGSSTPAGNCNYTDIDKEADTGGKRKRRRKKKVDDNDSDDEEGKKRSGHHMCDVCGKSFPVPSRLKVHKRIHSDVKPFVCDVCGKSFPYAGKLTIHKRVHTGDRPYKCPHCDFGFKCAGHLQCHIKSVHEGARPHLCDVCGAAFSRTTDLTVHKRIHTGEKPHVCPVCGKGFIESGNLTKHRLIHTGEKPHSCPLCPAAFRWSYQLKTHIQSEH